MNKDQIIEELRDLKSNRDCDNFTRENIDLLIQKISKKGIKEDK